MVESKNVSNLAKAIIAVMKEVVSIDKTSTVGNGSNAYKAISDKDVKEKIMPSMANNGLCILPIEVIPTVIHKEIVSEYQGQKTIRQSVFTEVKTKYLLLHDSGESMVLEGYGHGVDPQDKSAGKATTYALKYALLYLFMVATGKIDDADNQHSEDLSKEKNNTPAAKKETVPDPAKTVTEEEFKKTIDGTEKNIQAVINWASKGKLKLSDDQLSQLKSKLKQIKGSKEEVTEETPATDTEATSTKPPATDEALVKDEAPATDTEAAWVTTEQIDKTLAGTVKNIQSVLYQIKKGKFKARDDDKKLLEEKLKELNNVSKDGAK